MTNIIPYNIINAEVEKARDECRDAYQECMSADRYNHTACYNPVYLEARKKYQRVMVEHGLLAFDKVDGYVAPDYLAITRGIVAGEYHD